MPERPTAPFGPVLTAIVTPFDREGAVDYATFWRLCRHLVDNGSDGVVVAGTTGESPTLSKVEKAALFAAAVDAVGERGSVVAGTGTYDTRESIELTEAATDARCDGVMAVTPYYSRPPQEGIFRHMEAIASSTDLPMMVYNIPGRTARLIEIETLVRLAALDNIVAVKDAVDDLEWSGKALAELSGELAVYSGSDALTAGLIEAGAIGVVSVASHVVGPQVARLVAAALEGDDDLVHTLSAVLDPVFHALFMEPSPMPVKAILGDVWGDVGVPRLPLVPAAPGTLATLQPLVAAAQAL